MRSNPSLWSPPCCDDLDTTARRGIEHHEACDTSRRSRIASLQANERTIDDSEAYVAPFVSPSPTCSSHRPYSSCCFDSFARFDLCPNARVHTYIVTHPKRPRTFAERSPNLAFLAAPPRRGADRDVPRFFVQFHKLIN